jgi:filamentous hemagglutinin family protein
LQSITKKVRVGAVWRWDGALCFFLGLQAVIAPGIGSAQSIRPDGRTQTAVTTQGAVTSVTTGTVHGANAFNSFSTFSVGQGTTANLHLPSGTANLVNLVRDARTDIHGILNSIKDGRIGGNVWFANPHGFIVGSTGVVNVGSLSVSTPTQAFVDDFFVSPGNPNDAAVAQLFAGTAPRNGTGLISIQGKVNAIEGISLSAGTINVAGSLYSGARFIGTAPDFTDVVNANGLVAANNVVVREGRIQIVADNDVAVSGTIAAPGGRGVRGGDISIRAGGNVDLSAGANIVARGRRRELTGRYGLRLRREQCDVRSRGGDRRERRRDRRWRRDRSERQEFRYSRRWPVRRRGDRWASGQRPHRSRDYQLDRIRQRCVPDRRDQLHPGRWRVDHAERCLHLDPTRHWRQR